MTDPRQLPMAQALSDAGYRLTQPRLAVLQVLTENDAGLSPEAIYDQGKAIYPSLGLVTVYRTLDLLTELGLVRRVHSEGRWPNCGLGCRPAGGMRLAGCPANGQLPRRGGP